MASLAASSKATSFLGSFKPASAGKATSQAANSVLIVRAAAQRSNDEASAVSRRDVMLSAAAVISAATLLNSEAASAAYGDPANVFGKAKKDTSFIPVAGDGFSLSVPAKWSPSRELNEYPGVVLRYEDSFDASSNLVVIKQATSSSEVTDFGSPSEFLRKFSYLLGQDVFGGETASEGGFTKNTTLAATILDEETVTAGGKTYLKVNVLTRTADGDEGGKHQLITAAVSNGTLYILKVQAGDKRWFKGARKFVVGADQSFTVA